MGFICHFAKTLKRLTNIDAPVHTLIFNSTHGMVTTSTDFLDTASLIESNNFYSINNSVLTLKKLYNCTDIYDQNSNCPMGLRTIMTAKFIHFSGRDILYLEIDPLYLGVEFSDDLKQQCDGTVLQVYKR